MRAKAQVTARNDIEESDNGEDFAPVPRVPGSVIITAPNLQLIQVAIVGTSPLMVHRFSHKSQEQMKEKQKAGSTAAKGKKRDPKDFDMLFEGARYRARGTERWDGVHAAGFRNGLIGACRLVNFKMTLAKLSIFIIADGFDELDGTPLVRIISDKQPEKTEMPVRLETGVVDISVRPMWPEWRMNLRIRYDADQFTVSDIVNLVNRMGQQGGIGEGRANSKKSNGIGMGAFRVVEHHENNIRAGNA